MVNINSAEFNKQDVELVHSEVMYNGFYSVKKHTLKHKRFGGGWTSTLQREVVQRRNAAGVLLYDPKSDDVVLVKQFRIGALNDKETPWLLEVVAGLVEPEESAEDIVKRESVEESNIAIESLWPVANYYPSPGGSSEMLSLFIGKCDASDAGGIFGLEEEGEDIKVIKIPFADAIAKVSTGEIRNAASIMSIQFLQINYDKIRREWSSPKT